MEDHLKSAVEPLQTLQAEGAVQLLVAHLHVLVDLEELAVLDPETMLFDREIVDADGLLREPRAAFENEPVFTIKTTITTQEVVEDARQARKTEGLLQARVRSLEWPQAQEGELEPRITYLEHRVARAEPKLRRKKTDRGHDHSGQTEQEATHERRACLREVL